MPRPALSTIDVQLIRAADLKPVPWKNGSGITREIAAQPPGAAFDAFSWRVSMADVAQAGPFSVFEGIDRIIVVRRGGAMVMNNTATGARHILRPGEPLRFPGEASIEAELPDGPIQDFNLMWRRGRAAGRLDVRRSGQRLSLDQGSAVLHCAEGAYRIAAPDAGIAYVLEEGDSLRLTLPEAATLGLGIEPLQEGAILLDCRIGAASAAAGRLSI
ncbi:HutD/Ves family protein [Pollutimonas bauzanensis]|uniref:Various environmental stresses-induced protein Ves n=1 Tax=Pollutimonas bauzanensis TaxID=658167 RepID=A0A1M5Y5A2_9BURK|nr:HutD family protein [Pollutimonas bauzanensis]SHI07227.1 hypothetical protein SAMN04488135_10876 [Pollutimonas bauzanensis]